MEHLVNFGQHQRLVLLSFLDNKDQVDFECITLNQMIFLEKIRNILRNKKIYLEKEIPKMNCSIVFQRTLNWPRRLACAMRACVRNA